MTVDVRHIQIFENQKLKLTAIASHRHDKVKPTEDGENRVKSQVVWRTGSTTTWSNRGAVCNDDDRYL